MASQTASMSLEEAAAFSAASKLIVIDSNQEINEDEIYQLISNHNA